MGSAKDINTAKSEVPGGLGSPQSQDNAGATRSGLAMSTPGKD